MIDDVLQVAIILPCHNSEKYLSRTLNALVSQNFALPYKIIAVNDNSKDATGLILDEFKNRFPSLIEVLSYSFSNLSKARNAAFESALKAKYVCFCDSDDIPHNNFVSSLYSLVENTHSDVGVCDYRIVKNGKILSRRNSYRKGKILTSFQACKELIKDQKCKAYVWNKIFASTLLTRTGIRFIPEKFVYEDLVFSFQCFSQANQVAFSNKTIYDYIVYPNSLSHSENPDAYLMHIDAYAACRMYAAFSLGKHLSFRIFHPLKKTMIFKVHSDLYSSSTLSRGQKLKILLNSNKLVRHIGGKHFQVINTPWEKYIIDLGFMKYFLLTDK